MRQIHVLTFSLLIFLAAGCWGCAGSGNTADPLPSTLKTVKPARGYVKKIAVALTQAPQTTVGKRMGDLFFDTLVQAIRAEDRKLRVFTPSDEEYPSFMATLNPQPGNPIDAVELARQGREAGFNGLLSVALHGIRPYSKKTGILWFRKIRYFISLDLTVDLYDPLTAAKIVGAVEEASIKISKAEFEAFQEGATSDVEELEEAIVDFGEELGELVAESLSKSIWMVSVTTVDGRRVYLPAGERAGLKPGARLAVFGGRRLMAGMGQERFFVPGPQIGLIQISGSEPENAEAEAMDDRPIEPGDIVIPIR